MARVVKYNTTEVENSDSAVVIVEVLGRVRGCANIWPICVDASEDGNDEKLFMMNNIVLNEGLLVF